MLIEKTERQLKVMQELMKIAQDFFQKNSSGQSMITVTRTDIAKDLKNGTVFITVLPESQEDSALNFAKRMRADLRNQIKKRLPIKVIPFVEIEIDEQEKAEFAIGQVLRHNK
jgi:ribosome-binding factor A